MMRHWYKVEIQNNAKPESDDAATEPKGDVATILIFDDIGFTENGVSAQQLVADLEALPTSVTSILVLVNSPGGVVFDAIAIANALRDQRRTKNRRIQARIVGIAASAASLVVMAAEEIQIAENAMVMVHLPWSVSIGDAPAHRQAAVDLEKIVAPMLATYKWHSQLSDKALLALLEASTWMDADEAIANGFATRKIDGAVTPNQAAVTLRATSFAKLSVPARLKHRLDRLRSASVLPASALEVLRACRAADCVELAEELSEQDLVLIDVQARLHEAKAVKAAAAQQATAAATAAAQRAQEIRGLCKIAACVPLAEGYVRSGMSLDDIRSQLTWYKASFDNREVNNGLEMNHLLGGGADTNEISQSWKRATARAKRMDAGDSGHV